MTSTKKEFNIKIPGKVVINGSYIVLEDSMATVVVVDRFLNAKVTIEPSETFNFLLDIKNNEQFEFSSGDKNNWIFQLISTTLEFLEVENYSVKIEGYFDEGFFLKNGEKSGLGSSSCLLICIVYSLFTIGKLKKPLERLNVNFNSDRYDKSLLSLLYAINKILTPKASGCDVIASYLGPINFSKMLIQQKFIGSYFILLGSFGMSTSTRRMLDLIKEIDWQDLKVLNKLITEKGQNKEFYEDYLDELRKRSSVIVPDRQYKILKKTFSFNIYGCGISGAGGEDAVWCITKDVCDIKKYWNEEFKYVEVCKLVDHGIIIN